MTAGGVNEVKVPALGESIQEATIARWLKGVGDQVKRDEILVELETDKVTLEVTSPASGILSEIRVEKGGIVFVGDILALVKQAEGALLNEGQSAPQQKIEQPTSLEIKIPSSTAVSSKLNVPPPPTENRKVHTGLAPGVRKMAEELKLNVTNIVGSGKGGRLTKGDILDRVSEGSKPTSQEPLFDEVPLTEHSGRPSNRREERVKMTRLRQRIAERLKEAQNSAAILTTFNEIDMSGVNTLRAKYKETFERKHGIKLGIMSFFVKACVLALKEVPAVNAEIDGTDIIYKNYYDIGVAVSTPQGLVVPVVRNADTLNFAELEGTIASLSQKARDGKLTIADMTGGTFTVSNGGVFGSLLSTPILNPPQTGILGMHKMQDRPVAIGGKVEIRPMMYVALSYDHRIIDGHESVTFLVRVKENLENPERLLLDM